MLGLRHSLLSSTKNQLRVKSCFQAKHLRSAVANRSSVRTFHFSTSLLNAEKIDGKDIAK